MDESAELTLWAVLSLLNELLAKIGFVLIWMIKSFKSSMGEDAVISASQACFRIVFLAFLWQIKIFIWCPPVVKRFMSIHTVVPVMVLRLVFAILGLVPIKVEQSWLYRLQVVLKLLGRMTLLLDPFVSQDFEHFLEVFRDLLIKFLRSQLLFLVGLLLLTGTWNLLIQNHVWQAGFAWQERGPVNYWGSRGWRIVSTLAFVDTAKLIENSRLKLLQVRWCRLCLKSYDKRAEEVLLAELLERQSIRIFRELVAFTFKTQDLQFKVVEMRTDLRVIGDCLFKDPKQRRKKLFIWGYSWLNFSKNLPELRGINRRMTFEDLRPVLLSLKNSLQVPIHLRLYLYLHGIGLQVWLQWNHCHCHPYDFACLLTVKHFVIC